jgi:hypothetical protein
MYVYSLSAVDRAWNKQDRQGRILALSWFVLGASSYKLFSCSLFARKRLLLYSALLVQNRRICSTSPTVQGVLLLYTATTGCWRPRMRTKSLNNPETRSLRHETSDMRHEARNPIPETIPDTRNSRPETRDPKHESRNLRHETRNPKPETRKTRPEIQSTRSETQNSETETPNPSLQTQSPVCRILGSRGFKICCRK